MESGHEPSKGRVHSYCMQCVHDEGDFVTLGQKNEPEEPLTIRVRYEVIPLGCISRGLVNGFEPLIIELSCGGAGCDDEIRRMQ